MKEANLSFPEVGLIAVTRGMLGAGVGLLIASKMPSKRRKMIAWPLVAIGALSTIPLVSRVAGKMHEPSARKSARDGHLKTRKTTEA